MCQGLRNSKRNKAESLSLGIYNLVWKFSVKTDAIYIILVLMAWQGEEPRGSQAAGKKADEVTAE